MEIRCGICSYHYEERKALISGEILFKPSCDCHKRHTQAKELLVKAFETQMDTHLWEEIGRFVGLYEEHDNV